MDSTTPSAVMRLPGKEDYINVQGMIVEARAHAIVERIKDIDDSLEVLCVDPDQCGFAEAPFVLIEHRNTPDGPRAMKVFDFWELNDAVVERVLLADSQRHDIQAIIDETNRKAQEAERKAYRDKMEGKKDLVASIINNTKSKFSYYDEERKAKITMFDDGRPVERKFDE